MDTVSNKSEGKITKAAAVGSILSGGLAAACCLGPALFVLLGIGGIGAITSFMQYRTPLMALSLVFLGTGFYFAYRKPRECGAECPPAAGRRLNRIILWMAAVLLLVFSAIPYVMGEDLMQARSPALSSGADTAMAFTASPALAAQQKTPETIPLAVKGMTCVSCERPVKKALKKLPGVSGAKVSYKKGEAVIEYDPKKVTPEQLIEAINKTGYSASRK
ncbi:MAG: mercuric transporter MerT family protein [Nitrospinota bacterium]